MASVENNDSIKYNSPENTESSRMKKQKLHNRLVGKLARLIWHAERSILYEVNCSDDLGTINWQKLKTISKNPFKGKSRPATLAIFKTMSGEDLSIYKIKNEVNAWHWFLVDNCRYKRFLEYKGNGNADFLFCPTKRQYKITGTKSPLCKIKEAKLGEEFIVCSKIENPLKDEHFGADEVLFEKNMMASINRWEKHLHYHSNKYIKKLN